MSDEVIEAIPSHLPDQALFDTLRQLIEAVERGKWDESRLDSEQEQLYGVGELVYAPQSIKRMLGE